MGWFKKLLGFAVVVGAAFLTFGGSIAAAGAWLTSGSIGAMVARTVLAIGLSKLVANRAGTKAAGGDAPSARFQLRPSTTNKVPLIYGSGYYGSVITDAIISTDNKTMWYVMACAEVTDSGTISFGDIYIDNRLVTFDGTDQTKVVSLTNNSNPPQVDTNIAGNMFIYKFNDGSSSGVNTAQTAIQILQDGAIPAASQWTSTDTMTDTAFIIVKLNFNSDKQVTGLGEVKLNMINSLNKPGAVMLDYMQNTRYGCAIPLSQIDTASLTALDTYSDELITYTPDGGGSATQARYRINGPIDLSTNCLSNLQGIADACDSWIQYSELVGKWRVVINKPYTGLLDDLYHVDSSVLIGGIDITPLDLNQTYNSIEVQYPAGIIKDQTVVRVIDLTDPTTAWYEPSLLSPNEPNNRLTIQYQIVNTYVQAVYLGVRRLLQSREDLTINCNLDYSGIQIEAGDVVRVTLEEYGWADKLFRVSTVSEIKKEDGNLGASIVAFEYNDTIYNDQAIQDYVPADNTGLTDPNIISQPTAPVITDGAILDNGTLYFDVASNVSVTGTVLYMDFNYGNSSNVQQHVRYTTVNQSNSAPYAANTTVTIPVNDLPASNYYWSSTARNDFAGRQSNSSSVYTWGGPGITPPTGNVGGVTGNIVRANTLTGNNIQSNTVTSNNMTITGVTAGSYTSANITVDGAGRITAAANGSGGGGGGNSNVWIRTSSDAFGPYSNTFMAFDNAFINPYRNQSLEIPGAIEWFWSNSYLGGAPCTASYTQSSADWDPWMQATSATANGFLANSTSAFAPANAQYQLGTVYNPSTGLRVIDGAHGWIDIGGSQVTGTANANSQYNYVGTFNLVSNANCTIQVAGGVVYANTGTSQQYGAYIDMSTVSTIDLIANRPQTIQSVFHAQGNILSNTWAVYTMTTNLKNPTANTSVYVTQGSWVIMYPDGWYWPQ